VPPVLGTWRNNTFVDGKNGITIIILNYILILEFFGVIIS